MEEMAGSIVVKRLVRNLRYRLTYLQIFESYQNPKLSPVLVQLLTLLMRDQQAAITILTSYLHSMDVDVQDLSPNQRLLEHAANRHDIASRLRFIHYGLGKAVSWYKMQLTDKQMTADPELQKLLFELGQIEAAELWRVEAVMAMLRISLEPESEDQRRLQHGRSQRAGGWHSRLMEDVGHPAWKGR
jgi:hypothetical protein